MDFIKITDSFLELGHRIKNMEQAILKEFIDFIYVQNPWFTPDNIRLSIDGLLNYLEEEKLNKWLSKYDLSNSQSKKVGIVMAGNIPMVGIHDMICVLLSGHSLMAKLSSQDDVLIPFIANELIKIDPDFEERIEFVDQLKGMDAVIATGSDNAARYFNYYFSKYPNIIRKNRTSLAVLNGGESIAALKALGHDIFSYFGLGCRNVSKIFIPKNYDITKLLDQFKEYSFLHDHHKYGNNYYYQKSILLVNQAVHLDNGFALFLQSERLTSPIAVIYYEYYADMGKLKNDLFLKKDKLQCIVSEEDIIDVSIKFGKAQMPEIWDYADNIDTMKFLLEI